MATHWNQTNLAVTVHATPAGRRTRCTVWRKKKYLPHFVLAGEPHEREDAETNYHEWEGGRCVHCKKTVEEITEPKPISLHEALKGN